MVPATLRDTGGRRRCCCRWPAAERCAPRNDGRCARGCGHQLAAAAGARAPGRGDRVSLTPSVTPDQPSAGLELCPQAAS
ncbi:hypothetical protein MRX96_025041 [Rhipicephalus microplus]